MQRSRLEEVSVSKPCPKRWAELVGGDERRFCGECRLHVTNLSALGRREAEAFLEERAQSSQRTCVTYVSRPDGGVRTREDLGAGRLPRRHRTWFAGVARVASLVLGFLAFLPGCRPGAATSASGGPDQPACDPGVEGRLMGSVPVPDPRLMGEMQVEVMGDVATPQDAGGTPPEVGTPGPQEPEPTR